MKPSSKKLLTIYIVTGGLTGFLILHPIAMLITGTKHMGTFFMWHDLLTPMSYYFTLLGGAIGLISGLFQNRIYQQNLILAEQKKNIEQTAFEKDTLLRILSHDLTNHIGCAASLLKAIIDDHPAGGSPEEKEDLLLIYGSLAQGQELIDFTRTLIAIESGKMEIKLIATNINQLLERSLSVFKTKCLEKNVLMQFTPPPAPLYLDVEPVVFKNCIINNILSNAIKFSLPTKTIEVKVHNHAAQCLIEISNIGPGLTDEKIKTIFSPSVKTSTVGTNNEKGTGFGLPLAYKFTKMMHGDITVTCRKDPAGDDNNFRTSFCIQLPHPKEAV